MLVPPPPVTDDDREAAKAVAWLLACDREAGMRAMEQLFAAARSYAAARQAKD